jgi:hypothetical protein
MAKIIEEEVARFADPESLEAQVGEYTKLKASIKMLETRTDELHKKLFERLDLDGVEDDQGNIIIELPTDVNGVGRIEKQRRASRKLDEPTAETIIESTSLADTVYEMKRVINEDALMAAYYEGLITEEQLDEMFPIKVVWALRTVKK